MTSMPPPPPFPPAGQPTSGKPPTSYDGVSIAALVCSVLCCAAPVGVVLGIFGILRTGPGRRRGRWAAVTGLVLGAVLSVVMLVTAVVGVVLLARSANDDLALGDTRAGMCIDLDWADTPNAVSCDEAHEGEIIWVGVMTPELMQEWDGAAYVEDFCLAQDVDSGYEAMTGSNAITVEYVTDTFWGEPKSGEWMACYLKATTGTFHAPLLPEADSTL